MKEKHQTSVVDMITCPICGAMSYPVIVMKLKETENSSEFEESDEMASMTCRSCNEDILPYIEAYKEYTLVREKQRAEEEAQKVQKAQNTSAIEFTEVSDDITQAVVQAAEVIN